ncbi:L-arabinitol 4-dehydrogenase [Colletotrichum orbiculare MAFF 240422]|uniref:L-arabinitol 4-dehydrogenase n=1 Tax=Colletotrichum orbiculare (strain 104-T / ATCC 96160 / CBS 514.97 / LARS 414 / MAFF 240422) TaxID=1213857 RepID=N4VP58_COLOR|nr:L-arabinitol 4-dehydrogenase [Colletotrichum orbiculare MAFF 240422]
MLDSTVVDILRRKPENLAVCTNPQHELYLKRTEVPTPGDGECLVHVRATGICGSDVHFWKAGHIGEMVVTGENGLGHESAGVVIATGPNVAKFRVGDRVALECGIPCMKASCFFCRTGRYNACPAVVFFSTPPYHGTLTRYHVHPEDWLHKMPDSMSYEEGSLLEPLSVALTGVERSGVRLGDAVVICGSGPIGIATLLAANAAGANPIVITDINQDRLKIAKRAVPRARTFLVPSGKEAQAIAEEVKTLLGQEAKMVLECTGVESSVICGIYACRFGGMVFVIGCGKDFATIPFMYMAGKEIDLRFQYRYRDIYPRAIGLVAEGIIDLKPLVTHRFTLEEGEKAFKTASDPTALALKVQVTDE